MRRTIKLLDGSLSYPIEKRGFNLNSKLWTAETLINNPQVIEDTHIDYLKSGVDYITTSSYQLSVRRLREEGYNISEIKRIFNQSVLLAKNALLKTKKKKINIVGSFGPFASYLSDGSEYTGIYKNGDDEIKKFHLENLEIINKLDIDIILFETIPCLREVKIINDLLEVLRKEVWISMTCNNDLKLRDKSSLKKACEILSKSKKVTTIGLNCFNPIIMKKAITKLKKFTDKKILVYPNSGEKFNSKTKTWHGVNNINNKELSTWINEQPDIIGGCCRIGKNKIKLMKAFIENANKNYI
tara:strand:+ start:9834 stop:10730 length:897 start_codon:yes stop_codon:yes gene_type:complete